MTAPHPPTDKDRERLERFASDESRQSAPWMRVFARAILAHEARLSAALQEVANGLEVAATGRTIAGGVGDLYATTASLRALASGDQPTSEGEQEPACGECGGTGTVATSNCWPGFRICSNLECSAHLRPRDKSPSEGAEAPDPCPTCNDDGRVHTHDGDDLGPCPACSSLPAEPVGEPEPEPWPDGMCKTHGRYDCDLHGPAPSDVPAPERSPDGGAPHSERCGSTECPCYRDGVAGGVAEGEPEREVCGCGVPPDQPNASCKFAGHPIFPPPPRREGGSATDRVSDEVVAKWAEADDVYDPEVTALAREVQDHRARVLHQNTALVAEVEHLSAQARGAAAPSGEPADREGERLRAGIADAVKALEVLFHATSDLSLPAAVLGANSVAHHALREARALLLPIPSGDGEPDSSNEPDGPTEDSPT